MVRGFCIDFYPMHVTQELQNMMNVYTISKV